MYDYKGARCRGRYVGENRRHLKTKIHEHLHCKPVPSKITLHNRLSETICLQLHKTTLMNEQNSSVRPHCNLYLQLLKHRHALLFTPLTQLMNFPYEEVLDPCVKNMYKTCVIHAFKWISYNFNIWTIHINYITNMYTDIQLISMYE